MDEWKRYALVSYKSIFNAPSLQLFSVDVPVSLLVDGIKVHLSKRHPKVSVSDPYYLSTFQHIISGSIFARITRVNLDKNTVSITDTISGLF